MTKKEVNNNDRVSHAPSGVRELLGKEEVSLRLANYDDLFSDFDSRHFAQRALSQDLLDEAKRATREAPEGVQLKFLLLSKQRSPETETIIKRRLREHFKKHAQRLEDEFRKARKKGIIMAIIGILLLGIATFLYQRDGVTWWNSFLIVLFEPAGWFTVWIGLEQVFFVYEESERKLERQFYRKMAKAEIKFDGY